MMAGPQYEGGQLLTPAEQQAAGLGPPPGPFGTPRLSPPQRSSPDPLPVTGFESPATVPPFLKSALPTILGLGAGAVGGPLAGATAAGLTAGILSDPRAGVLEAAGFLGGGLLGKGVGKGIAKLSEKKAMQFFEEKATDLATLVKRKVPAWASFPSGSQGLVKMFQGQDALSAEFDKELTKQIGFGRGKEIVLRVEDAAKLGAQRLRFVQAPTGPPTAVSVDASDAVQKVIGRWKKDPGLYRRVVEELDRIGVGDPKAREAYRWGSGTIQYLNATKALEGEEFRLDRAQAGLLGTKTFEILRKRGMGEFAKIVRGTADLPVVPLPPSPLREAAGGLGGAFAGGTLGHPIIGFGAGREAVRQITRRGFANIPQGPVSRGAQAIQVGSPLFGGALGGLAASQVAPQELP